ncbi:fasciclin domain-containing protein, partial [Streptomyces sp. NPDC087917]
MNSSTFRRTAVAAAALLPFALAACSSSDADKDSTSGSAASSAAATPSSSAALADGPFGPACAGVPAEGAGSFDGMAKDPVATAASNNP